MILFSDIFHIKYDTYFVLNINQYTQEHWNGMARVYFNIIKVLSMNSDLGMQQC